MHLNEFENSRIFSTVSNVNFTENYCWIPFPASNFLLKVNCRNTKQDLKHVQRSHENTKIFHFFIINFAHA